MKDQGTPTHDFASVTDFNNLYQSFTEARKGKRWKYSVCKYEANILENLLFIQVMLQRHKYRLSPYNCFFVHEPKERLIMYNSFRDKIVQHCLCEQVLEPLLSKTFIYDNYASQKGKGTHFGLDRLKAFMAAYYRKNGAGGWVLKCDVRKYFYRINHDVLKTQLRRLSRTATSCGFWTCSSTPRRDQGFRSGTTLHNGSRSSTCPTWTTRSRNVWESSIMAATWTTSI